MFLKCTNHDAVTRYFPYPDGFSGLRAGLECRYCALHREEERMMVQAYDIGYVPQTPSEQLEYAKLEVIGLFDKPDWQWLVARIHDEALSWPSIFELVAANV